MGEAAALVLVAVLIVFVAAGVTVTYSWRYLQRVARPPLPSERHRQRYIETGDLSALGDMEEAMEEEE